MEFAFDLYTPFWYEEAGAGRIWLWGIIDAEMSLNVQQVLRGLPSDTKIEAYIRSDGGDIDDALAVYEALKSVDTTAYCCGCNCSGAMLLISGCRRRLMRRTSGVMWHSPKFVWAGDTPAPSGSLKDKSDQLIALGNVCCDILDAASPEAPLGFWQALMDDNCDHNLSFEECLQIGFATGAWE